MNIGNYSKAIVGGLASACAAAAPLLQDGHISESDGLIIAGAFLASLGVVCIVPNASASQGHAKSSTPEVQSADTAPTSPPAVITAPDTAPAPDTATAIPAMPAADADPAATETPDADNALPASAPMPAPAIPMATDGHIMQGA